MKINKKELIESLEEHINHIKDYDGDMDAASWGYQEGILISGNEAKLFLKLLKGDKI